MNKNVILLLIQSFLKSWETLEVYISDSDEEIVH